MILNHLQNQLIEYQALIIAQAKIYDMIRTRGKSQGYKASGFTFYDWNFLEDIFFREFPPDTTPLTCELSWSKTNIGRLATQGIASASSHYTVDFALDSKPSARIIERLASISMLEIEIELSAALEALSNALEK